MGVSTVTVLEKFPVNFTLSYIVDRQINIIQQARESHLIYGYVGRWLARTSSTPLPSWSI